MCIYVNKYTHTCKLGPHTWYRQRSRVWKPNPEELEKKPARLRQLYHVCHTQIIGIKVSRVLDGMAGSSIPGRSVILSSHGDNQSLAASWGSHIQQSRPYMSAASLVRPRSAASWVAWRAVAFLAAPGCAFA